METYKEFDYAGLHVRIAHDDSGFEFNPRENFEPFGTMASWGYITRSFHVGGKDDLSLSEDEDFEVNCSHCDGTGEHPERAELWRGVEVVGVGSRESMEDEYDRMSERDGHVPTRYHVHPLNCPVCKGECYERVEPMEFFRRKYDADVIVPIYVSDHGPQSDYAIDCAQDPNAVIFLTEDEVRADFLGQDFTDGMPASMDEARAKARNSLIAHAEEYAAWAEGWVFGYIIEDAEGETLESCWGFIGDPDSKDGNYIIEEAKINAQHIAEDRAGEAAEVAYWRARDVETV